MKVKIRQTLSNKQIELTGIPCSGKSYYISCARQRRLESNFIFDIVLFFKGVFFIELKTIKYFFKASMRENLPFIYRLNIFRNIIKKFGILSYNNQLSNNNLIIDEGVSHIPFNLLNSDFKKTYSHLKPYLKKTSVKLLTLDDDSILYMRLKKRGHTRLGFTDINSFIIQNRRVEKFIITKYPEICLQFEKITNA